MQNVKVWYNGRKFSLFFGVSSVHKHWPDTGEFITQTV